MLKVSDKIKDFVLKDQNDNTVKLSDFLGKKLLIYFYPKDNTPGCTTQAKLFKEKFFDFERNNTVIIGVSRDSVKSHKKFCEKQDLNFTLLSDEEGKLCEYFDVLKEKSMFGKSFLGIERSSFLIDENGILIKEFRKVKPAENPVEILEYLEEA